MKIQNQIIESLSHIRESFTIPKTIVGKLPTSKLFVAGQYFKVLMDLSINNNMKKDTYWELYSADVSGLSFRQINPHSGDILPDTRATSYYMVSTKLEYYIGHGFIAKLNAGDIIPIEIESPADEIQSVLSNLGYEDRYTVEVFRDGFVIGDKGYELKLNKSVIQELNKIAKALSSRGFRVSSDDIRSLYAIKI